MTLLDITKAVALNVGEEQPSSAQDADSQKVVLFINETGAELARRVDWSALSKTGTIAGLGTDAPYDLQPDYDRLGRGMAVSVAGTPVRGSLTADEWFSLVRSEGTPRYFRLTGRAISFYPYPALGQDVTISYQSKNWAADAGGAAKAGMAQDTDVSLIPADLLTRGAIYRFIRHLGKDFSDYLAEYEAALADLAQAEGGIRQP